MVANLSFFRDSGKKCRTIIAFCNGKKYVGANEFVLTYFF